MPYRTLRKIVEHQKKMCIRDRAMIIHARQQGIGFAWVGFDGFYGSDPAFLRALEAQGEVFVGNVHKDQRMYPADPQPIIPPPAHPRGRPPRDVYKRQSRHRPSKPSAYPPSRLIRRPVIVLLCQNTCHYWLSFCLR